MRHHVRENASSLVGLLARAFNGKARPPYSALLLNYTVVSCMLSVNWMVWLARFIHGASMLLGILLRSSSPRIKLISNYSCRLGLGKGGNGTLILPKILSLLVLLRR